jgi:hypothetical protein
MGIEIGGLNLGQWFFLLCLVFPVIPVVVVCLVVGGMMAVGKLGKRIATTDYTPIDKHEQRRELLTKLRDEDPGVTHQYRK